jgi:hypothetical protein
VDRGTTRAAGAGRAGHARVQLRDLPPPMKLATCNLKARFT